MKRLKNLLCAGVALVVISLVPSAVSAQSPRFHDLDRDGNGRLSLEELTAAFGTNAAASMWQANGGLSLTPGDFGRWGDDDDDDGGRGWGSDDDDDDGGRDDDDDDGGRDDDDDDGGRDDDDDDGGRDDDDDDGGNDDDD